MPTVDVSLKDMEHLLGKPLSCEHLEELILYAKGEIETVDGDVVKIDIKDTNRPDLWSAEGIAREIALRFRPFHIPGIRKSGLRVFVQKGMGQLRPYTAACVVKNVAMTETFLRQIVQLQEKIDTTFGRRRREVAAGIYDYDAIEGDIHFLPAETRRTFTPLGFPRPMTLSTILESHPKGMEYGYLLKGKKRYPLFVDDAGNVLSMPPIINSAYSGRVTKDSRSLFIEVSGFRSDWLNTAVQVIALAFAARGAELQSVDVIYPGKRVTTPDFTPKKTALSLEYARKIIGLPLNDTDIYSLLEKSGYRVVKRGPLTRLEYPSYRQDIMHQLDVVEDIAITYGYNRLPPVHNHIPTRGGQADDVRFTESVTDVLIGAGLQEILSYTLTSRTAVLSHMMLPDSPLVEISNPTSANCSVFRNWLLPGLLDFLSRNKHVDYPQKIFEVGDCVLPDTTQETRTRDCRRAAVALTDVSMRYEDISSLLDAFLRSLGIAYILRPVRHPSFLPGRAAEVIIQNNPIGVLGEIHPHVLNNWGLEKPVAAFDIDLVRVFAATR